MTCIHILSIEENRKKFLTSDMASERLRLSYLAEAAISSGLELTVGPIIPKSANFVFLGKLTIGFGNKLVTNFISQLLSCEAKIIIDYTDDHLSSTDNPNFAIYHKLINMSDIVIVPTLGLSKRTKMLQKHFFIIPDGLDEIGPIAPRLKKNSIKEVLWFGHSSNLQSLILYLDGDFGLKKFNMNILCNERGIEFIQSYKFKNRRDFEIYTHVWSFDRLIELGSICDLKILPINKPFASANRLLTAFNLGLPVITTSIECYRPFSKFYAEIGSIEEDNLFYDPCQWDKKVLQAQDKIQSKFDKEKILKKWKKLFSKLMVSPHH